MAGAPVIGSIGELLVEFVCTEQDGHNLRAAPYVGPFPSGAPGIFIDQAARVGARAVFAGAVGDDAFGRLVQTRLAAAGVAQRLIRVARGLPTGTAHVSYNADGSRDFVFNIAASAAARFPTGAEAAEGFLAAGTQVLHVSGSTLGDAGLRASVLEVCRFLRGQGVAISVDPNIRKDLLADAGYLAGLRELIAMAAFVLPSDEDAEMLFPGESFETWGAALLANGAKAVVFKRGAQGCAGMVPGQTETLAAHVVQMVDPTGAGDCFCASFVTLFAMGRGLHAALVRANAAGALAVGTLGPMEGNATLAQIEAFLAAQA